MNLFAMFTGLAGVIQLIILIVLIVKFMQLVSDVKLIRMNQSRVDQDYRITFYKYLVAGDKGKAKEVLFDEIAKTKEFRQIVQGVNEKYANDLSNQLNERFKKELSILDMDRVDFAIISQG